MSVSGGNGTIINNYYGGRSSQQASTSSYWNNGSTWNNGRLNVIRDTRGDDNLRGTRGDDIFTHRGGNDTVDGGRGFDTLRLQGKKEDYTITKNQDGTYAIHDKVSGDKITAKNIESLKFGSGEEMALDSTNFVRDSRGDDNLRGTRGNDMFNHRGGNDTVDGGRGDDTLKLAGNKDDYFVRQNRDGSYTIRDKVTGDKIKARNIENLQFGSGERTALNSDPRNGFRDSFARDNYAFNNRYDNDRC